MKYQVLKGVTVIAVVAYLCVGTWFAYALKSSMPALNWSGAAYVALTWPGELKAWPFSWRPPICTCFFNV